MTPRAAKLAWVEQAQASVATARQLLARPTAAAVEQAVPELERASRLMGELERDLGTAPVPDGAALEAGLRRLRGEVARVRAALETAAAYHIGWANLLYTSVCGYTASGEPAVPSANAGVSVEA